MLKTLIEKLDGHNIFMSITKIICKGFVLFGVFLFVWILYVLNEMTGQEKTNCYWKSPRCPFFSEEPEGLKSKMF